MSVGLITGASRGLGLALTQALAERGWSLIVDARDGEALAAATADLGPAVRAIPGDVTDERHLQELMAAADAVGGLDALVLNAGGLGPSPLPPVASYPVEALADVFKVNVLAQLRLVQLALPRLRRDGRVLAVTSDAAREPYEGWAGYGASKAALEQLFNVLAAERRDLRVHRVDPGDMRTRMHADAFPGEDISDRPLPEERVPGLVRLLEDDLPSGRYEARALARVDAGWR
jgi:NAD(P)-dependent dehydrogenase (short-subunit alcohol dehydrogenase family)